MKHGAHPYPGESRAWAEAALTSYDKVCEWPPEIISIAPKLRVASGRNIKALSHTCSGYGRTTLLELLSLIHSRDMPRHQIILSRLDNGLAASFWSTVFDTVLAVAPSEPNRSSFEEHASITLGFGSVDDTRFLYRFAERIQPPATLLLDDGRYSRLISPYYVLRKRLGSPALCVIINSASDRLERQYANRFVEDLRSGLLDGEHHEIRSIAIGRDEVTVEMLA